MEYTVLLTTASHSLTRFVCAFFLCLSLLCGTATPAHGQDARSSAPSTTPAPLPSTDDSDEVIRVSTDLVQTDVMVLDQQGRFVEGLQREQFELRVDGRPQEISFFEQVRAGTADEDTPITTRSRRRAGDGEVARATPQQTSRRRTMLFFLDDVHLSFDSLARSRGLLLHFIEREMGQNDQAAIASTSGQLGFLQQFTGDKAVLRTAVSRLTPRRREMVDDGESPPMNEYQAHVIDANMDRDLLEYFIGRQARFGDSTALAKVRERARRLVAQSAAITRRSLDSLESAVNSTAQLPGRKLVFFLSEGFYLGFGSTDTADRLRRITGAAARAGVVIYTIDARGLATTPYYDASRESQSPNPRTQSPGLVTRSHANELPASQEPLHTIAAETGGRALLDTNALNEAVSRVLSETSTYYLVAWTPERTEQRGRRFRRIEVSIKDRPNLTVRVRRGYYEEASAAANSLRSGGRSRVARDNTPEAQLLAAIRAPRPLTALPTALSVGYMDEPNVGPVLTASVQLDTEALDFSQAENRSSTVVDVVSLIYNDQGTVVDNRNQRLTVSADAETERLLPLIISHQFRPRAPGLYQVRVAARDSRSGRTGSAMQWIEIPDLTQSNFALSSLFLGELNADSPRSANNIAADTEVPLSADRRFSRSSRLRFFTYIYNARRAATPPDVALQVHVLRDGQPVMTKPYSTVNTEGVSDLARIPYAAEIPLDGLPTGQYALQVTAIDRATGRSASQRVDFTVE